MKKFALLKLKYNANQVVADHECIVIAEAIQYFKQLSQLPLDEHGYYKNGETTFCVAEYFRP